MAVTATFTADFTDFNTEVKKAEATLDKFEQETIKAGGAITQMAGAAQKGVPGASTLTSTMRQFDSTLGAMGVNIGPATRAIEEIGLMAGKSAGELGKLGTAGAVLAAAVGGWQIGRKIAESLGTDAIIASATAELMGWANSTKEAAGAAADAIALANTRSTRTITSLSDAIAVNTKWLKDHQKEAQANAEAQKDWQEATDAVTIANQNHAWIVRKLNEDVREGAKLALEQGVAQDKVATAYALSASQIAALVATVKQEAEATKALEKARADAERVRKEADQAALAAHQTQLQNLRALSEQRMLAYGTTGQIAELQKLDAAELALTRTVYAGIASEKERLALVTQSGARRTEIANQIMAKEREVTAQIAQQLLAEAEARQTRNAALGLDAQGYAKVSSAAETLRIGMEALQQQALAGVPITERAALLMDQFAQANYEAAKATDQVTQKNHQAAQSFEELAAAMRSEAAAKNENRPKGGGLLPTGIAGTSGGVALDQYGRPTVAGGAISNLPIININSPLGTPDQIAKAVGDALTRNGAHAGRF